MLDDVDEVSGKGSGAFVEYATAEKEAVQLKVAISYVSIEQARLSEAPPAEPEASIVNRSKR